MAIEALLLVLLGSVFHLVWNLFAKGARDQLAFLWLCLLIPSLGGYFYIFTWINNPPHTISLLCLLATILAHGGYFLTLAKAYQLADLSFVYPYSRGFGVMSACLWGIALLGDRPSLLGYGGIVLAILALFIEPLSHWKNSHCRVSVQTWVMTILSGSLIGAYLLIDKIGLGEMAMPEYLAVMLMGVSWLLSPLLLKNARWQREWQFSKHKIIWGSFTMTSAYGAVLLAMSLAPLSYVVTARASGIAMSGLVGMLILNEKVTWPRWIAIMSVTASVICIGLA